MILQNNAILYYLLFMSDNKDEFGLMFGALVITFALLASFVVVGHVVHDWWRKRHGRGTEA